MKFARFEVHLDYLLTSHQQGWQILQVETELAGFLADLGYAQGP